MNRGRNTLILAVLAAALGAYIYFVELKREPASETPATTLAKVFDGLDAAKVEEVRITAASGDTTTVQRQNNAWQIVSPVQAAADDSEVSGIASSLSGLEVQRGIEEQPKDLATYGLATPRIQVAFRAAGDKEPRRLLIGDKTATGGELYAKLAASPRVFLISGFLESSFNRSTFELRDKKVLAFDRDKVDRLEVDRGESGVTASKQGDVWSVTRPVAARADFGAIESILSRLVSGQMKAIVSQGTETPATPLKTYGLEPAERRVTVAAGSTSAVLLLGSATPDGDVYAKDASRPLVFTVEKALADDLAKGPDDFRTKDVFGFRAFTGTRLEITRAGAALAFEKKKGPEKDAVEKWTQVQPAKAVDEAKIDDLVTKVASLRAESFVDALPVGAAEFARIATKFDEGKKEETVVLFKSGEDYYATRPGDAGAARLLNVAVTDIVTALEATQQTPTAQKGATQP